MRQLSDRFRTLIASLRLTPGLPDLVLGRSGWNLNAIEGLGSSGEPAAIPYLAPALISGNPHQAHAAAQAIKVLLAQTAVEDLPGLDEAMRSSLGYGNAWRGIERPGLAKWIGAGVPENPLVQLFSMHNNGYVRELAVRHLARMRDGSELPFLLLRLNDWVSQVRQGARDAVLDRIQPDYAERFVQNLALVIRLQQTKRSDHRETLERITRLLGNPEARASMMNAMGSGSRAGRRASFHMLVAAAAQDLSEVLKAALQLEDPVIRLWAARLAAAGLEQGKLRAVLHGLLRDPSAPVRREALRTWTAAFPEEAVSQQVLALSDRSASVRNEARFQLREKGEPYFQQLYRDALTAARPASLAVAIAGLGETGALSEAETLIPYLSHESARVRGAAVGSLIQLGGDRYVDLVMNRVMDASSAVSMRARKAVQWHIARIGGPRLWLPLSESRVAHVRRNLLHLIAALPKWDSITYLVQATQDDDERITELAQDYTNSWNQRYDRSQTTPTREQLALLQAALARAENALPAGVVALIRFVLRPFAAK